MGAFVTVRVLGDGCACAGGRVVSVASALRREVHCNILVVLVCPI